MPEFSQQIAEEARLYAEETDAPLPEKLNPNTRYAFFSHIAKGGKSLIKSCRDLHLRRTVCYKTLRPEFVDDPVETQRLLREARISAMLQHPNTIPTYELGRDNRGNYYFTMKLVHGYTLREVMNYRDRYDLSQLMDLIVQVARALGYAHSRGVVHRDIKPENILVGPYGEVLVLDWGLAKVWPKDATMEADESIIDEADAGEGKLQGTVMYMSPEQIDRDPGIDGRSDLYSLGSILYELLCGQTPFQGDVVHSLLEQIRSDIPPDPRTISKIPVPDVLAELAMSCLQKAPENRPATADDMLRILREDWG
ncbi:MAG: serine/threonine protein kinase [Oceanicoccus sp.]|uniref:serine/threonine protein kinase n=1 Tax=Oceanicoccus sp. TaxID=2691044 RepID=UPI00261AB4F0|nr:serine/threonine-protein kinase [Oceanicoccus sp.]MCP3908399.1 serine/threonine protein kinase [Oceanicoccus sp.]MDG1773965.1 serine/threonine-protein kinase [Oceanicoccus sp.]